MESIALFTWDCYHQGTLYDLEIAISHLCFVCCIPPGKSKVCVMLVFTDIVSWICCHLWRIWNDIHRFQLAGSITHEQNVKTQMMPFIQTASTNSTGLWVQRLSGEWRDRLQSATLKKTSLLPKWLHTSVVSINCFLIFRGWSKLCDITLQQSDWFCEQRSLL